MLHTISQSLALIDHIMLKSLLTKGDSVILMQDGVINGVMGSDYWCLLQSPSVNYFALESDVLGRGLKRHLSPEIQVVNFEQFVELTQHNYPQILW